jgi:hypothetical protein
MPSKNWRWIYLKGTRKGSRRRQGLCGLSRHTVYQSIIFCMREPAQFLSWCPGTSPGHAGVANLPDTVLSPSDQFGVPIHQYPAREVCHMVLVLASRARPQFSPHIRLALCPVLSQLAIFGHCSSNLIKISGDCIRKGRRSGMGGSCSCGFLPAPARSVRHTY